MDLSFKRLIKFFNRDSEQEKELPANQKSYQRSFNRFPIEFEVIATVIDGGDENRDSERSELHDVSGGGAMFVTQFPERYFPGQPLKLDIFLAGTSDVRACIKTEASVVRIHQLDVDEQETPQKKIGVAVKFHKSFEFERIDNTFFGNRL